MAPPRSLAIEFAIDSFRNEMADRARNAFQQFNRAASRVRSFGSRSLRKKRELLVTTEVLVDAMIPVLAHVKEVAEEKLSLRKRVATWLASRVTTAHIYVPPRSLSIAFFVAMLVLLTLPFGVIHVYRDVKVRQAEFRERKIVMVALSDQVSTSLRTGDLEGALSALHALEESVQAAADAVDASGIFKYAPPLYQTQKALQSAVAALGQGRVALAGIQRFPWNKDVFIATTKTLDAAERTAWYVDRTRLGIDTGPAKSYIRLAKDNLMLAQAFLGQQDSRYLVVFQNENEIRPTGGFMGSFAVLTLKDGAWSIEMPSQGSYALQGWLTTAVRAPRPLSLINPRFEFQDVNWFPDFPTTAKKIMSFYEDGGGSSVDGVIAVNSSFLNDVLALAGPLDVKEISPVALKNGTVVEALEKAIARDRATTAPKAVMGGLLDALATRFQSGAVAPIAAARLAAIGLSEKKIQLYFRDDSNQSAAARLGFDGGIPRSGDTDFFMLVSANVAGGKTDGSIHDVVGYKVSVGENGEMVAHVTLTRTHEGLRGDVLRGGRNVSYVRLYAPLGSEFLGANGFSKAPSWRFENPESTLVPDEDVRASELTEKIDTNSGTIIATESGKQVFGNWFILDPGEVKTVQLRYLLPSRITKDIQNNYALMVAKQSGRTTDFHFTMNAPGFAIFAADSQETSREGYAMKRALTTDSITRLVLTP
jgi:hypothetical protein